EAIRRAGAKVGISIKPATPVEALRGLLPAVDLVLVMSVEPGFGGQSFIPGSLDKVRELRRLCDELGVRPVVEIDGGISAANAAEVFAAGVDAVVAGSAVFKAADPEAEILRILGA
ncbi:MAG TPA: ribulose-phosphate 3-epimerase, partial [Alistipes sp.]|nr:ribulose-phosphate 3-epimerase [Alistipes sp.]